MNLWDAENLAKSLMQKYMGNLSFWQFDFNNRYRALGMCSYKNNTIYLSKHFVLANEKDAITETLLHEIAHALAGSGHGHDYHWKRIAHRLGANPRACAANGSFVKFDDKAKKYRGECPNCHKTFYAMRRNRAACKDCCDKYNGGRFSHEYVWRWSLRTV